MWGKLRCTQEIKGDWDVMLFQCMNHDLWAHKIYEKAVDMQKQEENKIIIDMCIIN